MSLMTQRDRYRQTDRQIQNNTDRQTNKQTKQEPGDLIAFLYIVYDTDIQIQRT